jgi:hypothetical protein
MVGDLWCLLTSYKMDESLVLLTTCNPALKGLLNVGVQIRIADYMGFPAAFDDRSKNFTKCKM